MSEDNRPEPHPEASGSREATAGESSNQPRTGFRQSLREVKKKITKKVSKPFKRSRHRIPAVQNVDHEGASSSQNIEDASRLHPSDGDKPATPENLSGCANQGASVESVSKVLDASPGVEEIPDPHAVNTELQGAREGMRSIRILGGHVTPVVSAANNAPAGLTAADDFQTTYLQPLKIFDTVIENLANLHPYAKMVLGMLSAASKVRVVLPSCTAVVDSADYSRSNETRPIGTISSRKIGTSLPLHVTR
ncbi:hypothetical protein BDR06DRAFT_473046 [Suillus hirtellus]|nr:hypothetical protein BDR06DRAFT_473046 [Suillus hirtellus]